MLTKLLSALLITGLAGMAPARAESLRFGVERALDRFPEFRAAVSARRAAQEQADQARGAWFPSVDLLLGQGRQETSTPNTRGTVALSRREAELTVSQLIFDGGAASGQIRRFEARGRGQALQVAAAAESLAERVATAYMDVLRLRGQLELADQSVRVHRETLRQVEILADGGAGRRSDVQQAAARLALAESAQSQTRGQFGQALVGYRFLAGTAQGELDVPTSLEGKLPAKLEDAIAEAVGSHPVVRASQRDLEAAQADRDSAKSRLAAPRVNLELGVSRNRDVDGVRGDFDDRFAMFRLSYNLFRGGSDDARVRESQARVEEATANLDRARGEVERNLRQAWEALRADRERMPKLAMHASMSVQVAEAYRTQFRIGQRSLLDVLNAENEQYSARANVVAALYSIAAGEARVLSAAGRLLEALGIALPEDPPATAEAR